MITNDFLHSPETYPSLIYHYTEAGIAIESILSRKELLLNSLTNTSDPLEFQDYSHVAISEAEPTRDQMMELSFRGEAANDIVKRVTKIACFASDDIEKETTNPRSIINKGYCRARMWSQYADSHRGVCLIFDREAMSNLSESKVRIVDVSGSATVNMHSGYITYNDRLPGLTEALTLEDVVQKQVTIMEWIEGNLDKYLFLKLEDYQHEHEFRICVYSDQFKDIDRVRMRYEDALLGIILGCRFPDVYRMNIVQHGKENQVPVFQLMWYNGIPVLEDVWS